MSPGAMDTATMNDQPRSRFHVFVAGIIMGMLVASTFSSWTREPAATATSVREVDVSGGSDASAEPTPAAPSPFAPEKDGAIVAEEGGEPCPRKYLLLTTQRSGSTWACKTLHQQEGVSCGGRPERGPYRHTEMLLAYSPKTRKPSAVTWGEYRKSLDEAFAEACQYHRTHSIGFKLMYNQIPPQFLEGGELGDYLGDNGISVVHLVRESKILVMSSRSNVKHRKKDFGKVYHTTNATLAEEIRNSTEKIPWNDRTIDDMLKLEAESTEWQAFLHGMAPLVPYHYLSYERLLSERDFCVGQLVRFLTRGRHDASRAGDVHANLTTPLQLSDPTCAERVADYAGFRAHEKARRSRSVRACDLIERSLGRPSV